MGAKSDNFCLFSAYFGVFSPDLLMEYKIFILAVDISKNLKNIDIDKAILKYIDINIDKGIWQNIDIDYEGKYFEHRYLIPPDLTWGTLKYKKEDENFLMKKETAQVQQCSCHWR